MIQRHFLLEDRRTGERSRALAEITTPEPVSEHAVQEGEARYRILPLSPDWRVIYGVDELQAVELAIVVLKSECTSHPHYRALWSDGTEFEPESPV